MKKKLKTIGTLGPEGSYSEQAVKKYSSHKAPFFYDSISEVIQAVGSKRIKVAVLPLENSIHGTVLETLDGIYHDNLVIQNEIIIDIQHVIAGINSKVSPKKIKYIYSHPQALGQCKTYLKKYYPQAKLVVSPSTSSALKKIKHEKLIDTLAIGSRFAAKLYGLKIVATNIQDVINNQTLFVAVAKRKRTLGNIKNRLSFTFLVIDPHDDRPGLLYEILGVFKQEEINLLKIESRPSREKLGSYIFYLKAQTNQNDKKMRKALVLLKKFGLVTLLT